MAPGGKNGFVSPENVAHMGLFFLLCVSAPHSRVHAHNMRGDRWDGAK
jgi:hypothetical protein